MCLLVRSREDHANRLPDFLLVHQINAPRVGNYQLSLVSDTNHLSGGSVVSMNHPIIAVGRSNTNGEGATFCKNSSDGCRSVRYLAVSQILIIKIVIFLLSARIDSLESAKTAQGCALFALLMVAFMAMHSRYGKYHDADAPQVARDRPRD